MPKHTLSNCREGNATMTMTTPPPTAKPLELYKAGLDAALACTPGASASAAAGAPR